MRYVLLLNCPQCEQWTAVFPPIPRMINTRVRCNECNAPFCLMFETEWEQPHWFSESNKEPAETMRVPVHYLGRESRKELDVIRSTTERESETKDVVQNSPIDPVKKRLDELLDLEDESYV